MKDLFGREVEYDVNTPAMTELERKRMYRRNASVPRGHAATPGTGPVGETCKSCANIARRHFSGVYLKCVLVQNNWTRGPKTDIRASDPACSKWVKA